MNRAYPIANRLYVTVIGSASLMAMALFIGGCVSQSAVPQDYFYRLPAIHPESPLDQKLIDGAIAVDQFDADGVYRERPLLYVDAQRPLEVLQYHYRHWIQIPSQLIQENFIDYLREANVADNVERSTGGRRPDVLIKGRLQKFERVVDHSSAIAVVEVEIEVRRKTPQGIHRITKTHKSQVKAQGTTIHETVTAFGQALRQIYQATLNDLQETRE